VAVLRRRLRRDAHPGAGRADADRAAAVGIDAIDAGAAGDEFAVVRFERELAQRFGRSQLDDRAAAVEKDADFVVVDPVEDDLAAGVDAQGDRADLDLGARIGAERQRVAARQRLVEEGVARFSAVRAADLRAAGQRRDAADAARRVGVGGRRKSEADERQNGQRALHRGQDELWHGRSPQGRVLTG